MTHSPHASFSSSFSRRVLIYFVLFAAMVFGALNAVGAFAASSNVIAHKNLDNSQFTIAVSNEKIVDVPTAEPAASNPIVNASEATQTPVSTPIEANFTVLDYSHIDGSIFKPVSAKNYVRATSSHLEAINGTRITTSSTGPLTGAGVVIGIIDSGINANLDTFVDQNGNSRIVAQSCFGDVSDIAPCSTNAPASIECSQADIGCFHGNAVADLAAGNRFSAMLQDGTKITTGGVAPAASISFARVTLNAAGELDESLLIQALNNFLSDVNAGRSYAPDVVNISIGFPRDGKFANCNVPSEIKSTIDALVAKGIPVVASSGNSNNKNEIMFPACLDNVISVGATEFAYSKGSISSENVANYSQSSKELDIVAPGSDIMATRPLAGNYSSVRGTSFATPIVTGSIALLLQANPNLQVAQIRDLLVQTGDRVNDLKARVSIPRINIMRAVGNIASGAVRFEDPRL